MKCFYVLSLNNDQVFSELGVRVMERIYDRRSLTPKQISLCSVYEADLDSEDFRQCVLNSIVRQLSMFDPIRISEYLGVIFIMVIGEESFPLRGKSILDFVVEWSENFSQSGEELVANDILIVLHVLAPVGQLQLLNDDVLSKIELMVNNGIVSN
ncbi:hypothetical protein OJ253_2860 [Cryptosporidium canis]|uniref:Uncharacterized protein n=1 Tax=Cryptosporidium canis TaxID=195482 RepID=A0A9D5HXT7_9CRYT|nr:hypothetical protein OJ253_2860 [Cryptosporidium canis]